MRTRESQEAAACSPNTIGGDEAGDHPGHLSTDSRQCMLKMMWSYRMKAASPCTSLGKFQIKPVLVGIPGGTPSSHEHKGSFRRSILHMPSQESTLVT